MFPVIFSIGHFSVSSFGLFLALAFLMALFLVWRLARGWDFDEEKIIDLTLLTSLGALLFSRIYFVMLHFEFFKNDLSKIILITKYPGFSFWGAFLGGWLTLYFFTKRLKMDFGSTADIAAIGFLGAQIFGQVGCLLGGCGIGIYSQFLGVKMIGSIGERFPVQGLEAIIFAWILFRMWPKAKSFHITGEIASLVLIITGLVKFFLEFLRGSLTEGHFFSLTLFVLGTAIFYKISKRSIVADFRNTLFFIVEIITKTHIRKEIIQNISKYCYNQKVEWSWRLRKLNVILTRKNNRNH